MLDTLKDEILREERHSYLSDLHKQESNSDSILNDLKNIVDCSDKFQDNDLSIF